MSSLLSLLYELVAVGRYSHSRLIPISQIASTRTLPSTIPTILRFVDDFLYVM
jgi:hypothetical protein